MTQAITIWLNGEVDLLARRVAKDGAESRPLVSPFPILVARLGSLVEGSLFEALSPPGYGFFPVALSPPRCGPPSRSGSLTPHLHPTGCGCHQPQTLVFLLPLLKRLGVYFPR